MIKNIKRLLKQATCKHEYVTDTLTSVIEDGKSVDSEFIFRCRKCLKNKKITTHGLDTWCSW